MTIRSTKEPWLLALGDIVVMVASLFFALALRNLEIPSNQSFFSHLLPFSFIWVISILAYYVAGAYERYSAISVRSFMGRSLQALWAIAGLAISLFYFVPFFGVTPKTVLFIYLGLFAGLHIGWRVGVSLMLSRNKMLVVLIADGIDADLFVKELSINQNIPLRIDKHISPSISESDFMAELVKVRKESGVIIVDTHHKDIVTRLPKVYDCLIDGCVVLDFVSVYGEIFNRLPLSTLSYAWLFEHITVSPKPIYDAFKRMFDILISLLGSVVPIVLLPFVYVAIKIQDGGPVFFYQERVGKNGNTISVRKFRSWDKTGTQGITPLGKFLRNTRIDELPQFWDVILGKISLIGPRPETIPLVRHYSENVPYYDVRHMVSPGLSGWAQVYHENHPHHIADVDETRVKVSYDLYYIMNRSFVLDITIAVKTIRTLLSRSGR